MKRLKKKQLGPWCSFCEPKTNRAVYRQNGFRGKFCCEEHKEELLAEEKVWAKFDERMTEADYQTWYNL